MADWVTIENLVDVSEESENGESKESAKDQHMTALKEVNTRLQEEVWALLK